MISVTTSTRRVTAPPYPGLVVVGSSAVTADKVFAVEHNPGTTTFEIRENGQIIAWQALYSSVVNDPFGTAVRIGPPIDVVKLSSDPTGNPPAGFSRFYVHDNGAGTHQLRIRLPDGTIKGVTLT